MFFCFENTLYQKNTASFIHVCTFLQKKIPWPKIFLLKSDSNPCQNVWVGWLILIPTLQASQLARNVRHVSEACVGRRTDRFDISKNLITMHEMHETNMTPIPCAPSRARDFLIMGKLPQILSPSKLGPISVCFHPQPLNFGISDFSVACKWRSGEVR